MQKKSDKNKVKDLLSVEYVPFEQPLVKFVDHIINTRIKLGRPLEITNEKHWDLVKFIFTGWNSLYPDHSNAFLQHMKNWRRESRHLGVSREGEAMIQHRLEIPQTLYSLIMTAFPNQKWTSKFTLRFAKELPILSGSEKL